MTDAISTALAGLQAAAYKTNVSAARIANPATQDTLAEDLVNLGQTKNEYKANVNVIKTAEEMEKDLLRVFDRKV